MSTETPLTDAELQSYLGTTFAPPPIDRPVARALYFIWAASNIPPARADEAFLVCGIPDALADLEASTKNLRMQHLEDMPGLLKLARKEARA